ncbi:MAG TPA: GntR family transcriptional regulator [Tissierellia bacterium]|nr:GntR family transcriptional regulator [Tissierellia bacterium]
MENKNNFLYLKVYNKIKDNIISGLWEDGCQLPTEYDLMKKFNVSRHTIRKSLQKLSEEGYIYRQAGRGTFVRHVKSRYKLTALESFTEQMINRGFKPSNDIVDISLEFPDSKIAKYLELEGNEKVYKIVRIRKADNEPMAYEITYVPKNICPGLGIKVEKDTSLYKLYEEEYGLNMDYGNIYLEAEKCNAEIAKKLNIEKNSAMLKMSCIVYLDNKKPLYFVECFYIGNKYIFFASMPRKL